MKKVSLLVGVAVGFLLGSRAGREPYERLAAQVRWRAGRADAKRAVNSLSGKAKDLSDTAVEAVNAKVTDVLAGNEATEPAMSVIPAGPSGPIDHSESDAELDQALEHTFPTSDPSSPWAGPDVKPERSESRASK